MKIETKKNVRVEIDGRKITAPIENYVKVKWRQMREFGYSDLTIEQVRTQLDLVLAGEKEIGKGKLDVIGRFIETDKPEAV